MSLLHTEESWCQLNLDRLKTSTLRQINIRNTIKNSSMTETLFRDFANGKQSYIQHLVGDELVIQVHCIPLPCCIPLTCSIAYTAAPIILISTSASDFTNWPYVTRMVTSHNTYPVWKKYFSTRNRQHNQWFCTFPDNVGDQLIKNRWIVGATPSYRDVAIPFSWNLAWIVRWDPISYSRRTVARTSCDTSTAWNTFTQLLRERGILDQHSSHNSCGTLTR